MINVIVGTKLTDSYTVFYFSTPPSYKTAIIFEYSNERGFISLSIESFPTSHTQNSWIVFIKQENDKVNLSH